MRGAREHTVRQGTREPFSSVRGSPHPVGSFSQSLRQPARQKRETYQEQPSPHAYIVRYEEATEREYLVRTLADDHLLQVPKSYAPADPFPLVNGQRVRGTRLLRWSRYALLSVGLGGLLGVLLGLLVVLATGVQLARFSWRVRRWRRRRQSTSGIPPLPTAASAERLRLLGALGQGLLAVVLGTLLFVLLAWHLL